MSNDELQMTKAVHRGRSRDCGCCRGTGKGLFGDCMPCGGTGVERAKPAGIGSHTLPNAGESDVWLTPPQLLAALGPFDVDPCCPRRMPWRTATTMLTAEWGDPNPAHVTHHVDDGCDLSYWAGLVWVNPPYSDATRGRWGRSRWCSRGPRRPGSTTWSGRG